MEEQHSFNRQVREELRHWPYTIHQIDDTLDASLIEGRGKQLLFQALNSQMLTAFVGSGVSAAYGRMTWMAWRDAQVNEVQTLSNCFLSVSEAALTLKDKLIEWLRDKLKTSRLDPSHDDYRAMFLSVRWLEYRKQAITKSYQEVKNLQATFNATSSGKGSFPGGEDLPVMFEIAKKLHDLLLYHRSVFIVDNIEALPTSDDQDSVDLRLCFGSAIAPMDGAPIKHLESLAKKFFKENRPTEMQGDAHSSFKNRLERYVSEANRPEAKMSFARLAKSLLVDESSHAHSLLEAALEDGWAVGRETNVDSDKLVSELNVMDETELKRGIDGIRQNPNRYRILNPFRINETHELIKPEYLARYPSVMHALLKRLDENWGHYLDASNYAPIDTKRQFLTPTSRFLVPLIWQLLENPLEQGVGVDQLTTPLDSDDFLARRSLIANRLDPLVKLAGKLRVNRYLTTNYDFEIERMYQDRGYRQFRTPAADSEEPSPYQFRTDGVGGVVRDLTFSSDRSTDLLSFSAGGTGADANIFHLHGRATKDDRIVITERDYMDMYLRDDPNREIVDESILMAFGANPILFLGLGMGESDLLRPLRQFISDKDRQIGYRSIVLMAATKDFDSRAKFSAGLYTRYGAHTVFFGSGEVTLPKEASENAESNGQSIDWLHRISELMGSLSKCISKRREEITECIKEQSKSVELSEAAKQSIEQSRREGLTISEDEKKIEQYTASGALTDPTHEFLTEATTPLITLQKLVDDVGVLGDDLAGPSNIKSSDKALPVLLGLSQACFSKTYGDTDITDERIRALTIQNCHFTSRRRETMADGQSSHRNVKIDGGIYCAFYTDLLTELMHISLQHFDVSSLSEGLRSLNSMSSALDGLKGAFMTACLSASLDGLEQEWRTWWKDWQQTPPHREARFEKVTPNLRDLDKRGKREKPSEAISPEELERRQHILLPARQMRHRVESVITDLSHCYHCTAPIPKLHKNKPHAFDKAYLTRVRILDSFIYEVAHQSTKATPHEGRRVQTIAASRGQGKGVFFSTLATRLGLTSYISAAHHTNLTGDRSEPVFVSAMFVNLSFAAEIGSVFDMLFLALIEAVCVLKVLGTSRDDMAIDDPLKECAEKLSHETAENCRMLMGTLFSGETITDGSFAAAFANKDAVKLDKLRESLSLAIDQSTDVTQALYRDKPRSTSLRLLLNEFHNASDQFTTSNLFNIKEVRPRLLICLNAIELLFDDQKRPKNLEISRFLSFFFSEGARKIPFDLLLIGSLDRVGGQYNDDTRLTRVFEVGPNIPPSDREKAEERAKRFEIKPTAERPDKGSEDINYFHSAYGVEPTHFLADNFPILALALFHNREEMRKHLSETAKELTEELTSGYQRLKDRRDQCWLEFDPPKVSDVYQQSFQAMNNGVVRAFLESEKPPEIIQQYDLPSLVQSGEPPDRGFLVNLYATNVQTDRQDWENLRAALRGNRYCLTILMAAAQHIVLTNRMFSDGGEAANIFLRNTVSHLLNASVSQKEEIVLNTVMNVYRERSIIGEVDYDHELHMLMMRNLAVLGCPISPNVLVRLPEIREYFNHVSMGNQLSRRRMIARALAVLSERGLVFRLSAHPKLVRLQDMVQTEREKLDVEELALDHTLHKFQGIFDKWPAEREYRYALHRQVQSHCFERLGHLTAPPVSANSFCPTLYSSMPSRVVRLSQEGYAFLRRLLLGLSQYPDIRYEDAARDVPIFTDDDEVTKVQALRSAMSLVRTCLSIAAVSRFDDIITGLTYNRKRGHFETYKVRLRWILRKAWEVHSHADRVITDEVRKTQLNALYLDEIVWLYNEVAVICLVQGALLDAIGHARQALKINREIEGDYNNGSMHNMISLNLAVMQIERGRLTSAKRRLEVIKQNERTTHKRVHLLAEGYLALIAQLRGQLNEAKTGFRIAIRGLEKDNEIRALAILLHHQARLLAREDEPKATMLLKRARDYAESGGHEDIRHRILISEVWLSQDVQQSAHTRVIEDRIKLREVESYAYMMGLSSLLVDALHVQGRMLLGAGDTIGSGRLLTRAMAIARRYDMTLRLNSLLTNYASVLLARKRVGSAKRLLVTALAMAKRSGYSLEVVRIHKVMAAADTATSEV